MASVQRNGTSYIYQRWAGRSEFAMTAMMVARAIAMTSQLSRSMAISVLPSGVLLQGIMPLSHCAALRAAPWAL